MRPLDKPRCRRIGAAGRAALAERMEWRGDGGRGFGEYLAEGRLNRIWGEFLCVCGGGEDFRAVGGGSLVHGRFLQVQSHVSVKRQAEARSICVSRVQDRTCVGCNATATGVL